MLYGSLDGKGIHGRMATRVCMAESLHWSPETITTLSVNWLYPNTEKLKKIKYLQHFLLKNINAAKTKESCFLNQMYFLDKFLQEGKISVLILFCSIF